MHLIVALLECTQAYAILFRSFILVFMQDFQCSFFNAPYGTQRKYVHWSVNYQLSHFCFRERATCAKVAPKGIYAIWIVKEVWGP